MASGNSILEQLFSSKTRVKLLTLYLTHPEQAFYVRELTRRLDERINSIRRELANLESIGFLQSEEKERRLFYSVNEDFYCLKELQSFFLKVNIGPQDRMEREIKQLPGLEYALLSGFFTNNKYANTDMFLVGQLDKAQVGDLVGQFERELDREVNFTIMSVDEFQFRRDMRDAFIQKLFSGDYKVIHDNLKKKQDDGLMSVKKLQAI